MKASPVRPGDYLEFFAEIDLLGACQPALVATVPANIPVTLRVVTRCW